MGWLHFALDFTELLLVYKWVDLVQIYISILSDQTYHLVLGSTKVIIVTCFYFFNHCLSLNYQLCMYVYNSASDSKAGNKEMFPHLPQAQTYDAFQFI